MSSPNKYLRKNCLSNIRKMYVEHFSDVCGTLYQDIKCLFIIYLYATCLSKQSTVLSCSYVADKGNRVCIVLYWRITYNI